MRGLFSLIFLLAFVSVPPPSTGAINKIPGKSTFYGFSTGLGGTRAVAHLNASYRLPRGVSVYFQNVSGAPGKWTVILYWRLIR